MYRHKSCKVKILILFGNKRTKYKRNRGYEFPKTKPRRDNNNESSCDRIAQSVSTALKPLLTLSSQYSSPVQPSSNEGNPSILEANTEVSYCDNSNISIEFESDDIPTIRASINSYLRLADASYRCITQGYP